MDYYIQKALNNLDKTSRGKLPTYGGNINVSQFLDDLRDHIDDADYTKARRDLLKLKGEQLPYEATLWVDDLFIRLANLSGGGGGGRRRRTKRQSRIRKSSRKKSYRRSTKRH